MAEFFQKSNLDIATKTLDSWRVLARQMNPSQGPHSGNFKMNRTDLGADAKWLRKFEIIVYGSGGGGGGGTGPATQGAIPTQQGGSSGNAPATKKNQTGIDLSELRVTFHIEKSTNKNPNTLYARIYNLSPATMKKVIEHTRVQVKAGHVFSAYGVIFDGTVVQYVRGKENPTDTFLDIYAGDGDKAINNATIFQKFEKGAKEREVYDALLKTLKERDQALDIGRAYPDQKFGQDALARARILTGQSDAYMRQLEKKYNYDAFVDNGQYKLVDRNGFLPGQELVLSPKTGLVGIPEVTPQGIQARCLLDPRIRLGGVVRIADDLLSGVPYIPGTKADTGGNVAPAGGVIPRTAMGPGAITSAFTSPTGRYKIILMKLSGDTRGLEWYNDLSCLALGGNNQVMAQPGSFLTRAGPQVSAQVQAGQTATQSAVPALNPSNPPPT